MKWEGMRKVEGMNSEGMRKGTWMREGMGEG